MITPQEIQAKEFNRTVRGYKEDEVDIFLDQITMDLEALLSENSRLKDEIDVLNSRIDDYKTQEGSVVQTLEAAKSLMTDISESAEKRADIIVRNAEIDAASMLRQAKNNLVNLQAEEKMLSERILSLRNRFRALLKSELNHFDELAAASKTYEAARQEDAAKEFDDLLNSVDKDSSAAQVKDLFDDEAFKGLQESLDRTIVSIRKDIE